MSAGDLDQYSQPRLSDSTVLRTLSAVAVFGLSLFWFLISGSENVRNRVSKPFNTLQEMASRLSWGLVKRPVPDLAHRTSDSGALNTLQRGLGAIRSITKGTSSDAPAGLGNWDNSCYQNSVIQGLASLRSFPDFLGRISARIGHRDSMNLALLDTLGQLNSPDNNGKQLWLPSNLKTMSTWQQQDAQEYFSKILDEVDKEAIRTLKTAATARHDMTFHEAEQVSKNAEQDSRQGLQNPLEGLIAQRVACKSCGHSDGISLIPFNCLTVPLGRGQVYDIRDCLDEYTKLEEIDGVQCPKCTLLQFQSKLRKGLCVVTDENLKIQLGQRLQAVTQSLEDEDYSDNAILKSCQIPKQQWAESTKTKQAVIARAAKSFVFHVNRSMFNEMTGEQLKNPAGVQFPLQFNLGDWMLGSMTDNGRSLGGSEHWSMDALETMGPHQPAGSAIQAASSAEYELRAVVTHYGRHDNGHYVCYRKHPAQANQEDAAQIDGKTERRTLDKRHSETWWRLSDDDVSPVPEDMVLCQGGVFMLFYERVNQELVPRKPASPTTLIMTDFVIAEVQEAASIPLPGADEDLLELVAYHSTVSKLKGRVHLPTPPESVAESDVEELPDDYLTQHDSHQGPAQPIPMRTSNHLIDDRGSQESLMSHRMVTTSGLAH